jgi:beta-lactam-binding protein with PASTA domain
MDGTAAVLIAILTSAATAVGTVYVIERYNVLPPKGPVVAEAIVPDMHGMSESDARTNANAAQIALFVTSREASTESKPGTVLRQSVAAGHRVAQQSSVSVVLAEEIVKVPNVINLSAAEARQRIEQRGFSVQITELGPDAGTPEGVVVNQVPQGDVAYATPGVVILQASPAPPREVEVPKLVGTAWTVAKTRIEELGLKAAVHWITVGETPTNIVLNQDPAAGRKAKPGDSVSITVCTP